MTFTQFVCWDPDEVQPAIAPDIAAATDAILLATHQSLPIEQCSTSSLEAVERVREHQVLEEFLRTRNDPMLMAVVGPSGSGKSHLIRWMHAHLKDDPRYH